MRPSPSWRSARGRGLSRAGASGLLLAAAVAGCGCGAPEPEASSPSAEGEGEAEAATSSATDTEAPRGPAPASPQLRWPHNSAETGSPHALQPDDAHASSLRPRFLWNPVESASRYEIEIDDDCAAAERAACAFDSPEVREGVETASFRPAAPLPVSMEAPVGRRYFWRVRACNEAGCSGWSSVRYVDVGRAASDFNGDGYADLVLARLGGGPFVDEDVSSYEIAFGSSEGTPHLPPRQLRAPDGCRVGRLPLLQDATDIDGDGFDDLGVLLRPERDEGARYDRDLGFLFGATGGLERCRRVTSLGVHPYHLSSDLTGDGTSTVLVCAEERSFWSWRHDTFTQDQSLTLSDACHQAHSSLDADSDGTSDLVGSSREAIQVFRGRREGLGSAASGPPTPLWWHPAETCTGDFDGDGYLDLWIRNEMEVRDHESDIAWGPITSPGSRTPLEWPTELAPDRMAEVTVACGDFDGDGRTDLVRRVDQSDWNGAVTNVQWFRWNRARDTTGADLTDELGSSLPRASLDVDGDGSDELISFANHNDYSEIIVLHDLEGQGRTRLRHDRGVRLLQTSRR